MNWGIRWLWVGMLGGSVLLATGGNTTLQRFIGDVVGHFFSAAVLAIIPILGFYLLYKRIGRKKRLPIFLLRHGPIWWLPSFWGLNINCGFE